jgi:hypothetical protein
MDKTDMGHIHAPSTGELPGVHVIGFHGRVASEMTPARRGPVYADDRSRLLRIVQIKPGIEGGYDVWTESVGSVSAETGTLPGVGTRVGPWPARLDDSIVILGPSEVRHAYRMTPRTLRREPPSVEKFVQWLRSPVQAPPEGLTCQRLEEMVAWYCSKAESFALWQRIHRIVEEEFFKAVTAGDRDAIERTSFWLSRAMIAPQDIYLAGAGLRRVASPLWKVLVREGLRLPDEKDWQAGLEDAERLLEHPPPMEGATARISPELRNCRDHVRQAFRPRRAA